MSNNKSIAVCVISIIVTCLSCTKEKIEFEKQYSGDSFNGFVTRNSFIVHDESISYYENWGWGDSTIIFGNLFEYQNGRKLGKSVHSLDFFEFEDEIYGIITVEGENMIEIIDKNFISVNQIPLNSPRNIRVVRDYLNGDKILVSYGDHNNGGLASLSPWGTVLGIASNFVIIRDSINTGNHPGAIYVHNNYVYVSSTGINANDSTIAKIYFDGGSLKKVENVALGKRPIILFDYVRELTGNGNPSLVIHCLGDDNEPPKMVYYDMVAHNIFKSHNISNDKFSVQILGMTSNLEFIYKLNNKLYQGSLESSEPAILLTERNITSLLPNSYKSLYWNEPGYQDSWPTFDEAGQYIGFSSVENEEYSTLYQFNVSMSNEDYFEIVDSITINKDAKKIVASRPY